MVVLSEHCWLLCCCCRANIRILVKDTVAAKNGYGPYVEPVSIDINSQGQRELRAHLATATAGVVCQFGP